MKITKQRLKEIIKEEIAALSEKAKKTVSDEISAQIDKGKDPRQAAAIAYSKQDRNEIKEEEDPDMDSEKDESLSDGVRDGSSGADRADGYGLFQRFYDAGYNLGAKKSQEDALVLPDAGTAGVVKSRQALKRAMNQRQRQRKLRYKD